MVDWEVYEVDGRVYAVDPLVVDSGENSFNKYHLFTRCLLWTMMIIY